MIIIKETTPLILNWLEQGPIPYEIRNEEGNIFVNSESTKEPIIKKETLTILNYQPQVQELECNQEEIIAHLVDGRRLSIPNTWFPRLRKANLEQLQNYRILSDRYHIHWPDLDEDISLRVFTDGLESGCC